MMHTIMIKDERLLQAGTSAAGCKVAKGRDEKSQFAKGRALIKGRAPQRPAATSPKDGMKHVSSQKDEHLL